MKRTTYLLLGILLALGGTVIAADIPVAGGPFFKDGALWARKAGTTNTKQDITSTSNALDVHIASSATTPPTGTSSTTVQGTAADGAAAVGSPVQMGAVDTGGLVQAVCSDANGVLCGGSNTTGSDDRPNTLSFDATNSGSARLKAVALHVFDGSAWDRSPGNSTDGMLVNLGANNDVLSTSTYTNNANQPALSTGTAGNFQSDSAGNLRTAPQRPTAADILAGFATVTATTGTTTLITVSAGRTWVGTLCASVSGTKAGAATGNGLVNASFLTTGTNVIPAAGTYFQVSAGMGANVVSGTVGTQGANANCTPFTTVAPAGNTTTINYVTTCTSTTSCEVDVSAIGVMQ